MSFNFGRKPASTLPPKIENGEASIAATVEQLPQKTPSVLKGFMNKVTSSISSLFKKKSTEELTAAAKEKEIKHEWNSIAKKELLGSVVNNYKKFIGEIIDDKNTIPSIGMTIEELAQKKAAFFEQHQPKEIVETENTETKETNFSPSIDIANRLRNIIELEHDEFVIAFKELISDVQTEESSKEMKGETQTKITVQLEEVLQKYEEEIVLNNSREKAWELLVFRLSKRGLLEYTEEEQNAHRTRMAETEIEVYEVKKDITDETKDASSADDEREVVLVGNGVSDIKNEKKDTVNTDKEVYFDKRPALTLQDTDKVIAIVKEHITAKNDRGGILKLMQNIPTEPAAREKYLQNIIYALHAVDVIDLKETSVPVGKTDVTKALNKLLKKKGTPSSASAPLARYPRTLTEVSISPQMEMTYKKNPTNNHPIITLQDTDKVIAIVEEYVTEDNDRAGILKLMQHIPVEPTAREKYLQNVIYALHAAKIIDFPENVYPAKGPAVGETSTALHLNSLLKLESEDKETSQQVSVKDFSSKQEKVNKGNFDLFDTVFSLEETYQNNAIQSKQLLEKAQNLGKESLTHHELENIGKDTPSIDLDSNSLEGHRKIFEFTLDKLYYSKDPTIMDRVINTCVRIESSENIPNPTPERKQNFTLKERRSLRNAYANIIRDTEGNEPERKRRVFLFIHSLVNAGYITLPKKDLNEMELLEKKEK